MNYCFRNIALSALTSFILIVPALAADIDVGDQMKLMGKSYRAVMQDKDTKSMQTDLANLRAAAVTAKAGVPGGMEKLAADSQPRKTFAEGMDKLILQIDVTKKYADEGKLPEAKKEAAKLKVLMTSYHKQLKV